MYAFHLFITQFCQNVLLLCFTCLRLWTKMMFLLNMNKCNAPYMCLLTDEIGIYILCCWCYKSITSTTINSLAFLGISSKFTIAILKLIWHVGILQTSCRTVPMWILYLMDWCQQAAGHDMSQCWPRFLLLYDETVPQWGKTPFTENMANLKW